MPWPLKSLVSNGTEPLAFNYASTFPQPTTSTCISRMIHFSHHYPGCETGPSSFQEIDHGAADE